MAAPFEKTDDSVIVVIGTGAGGGVLANELAQKGVSVVALEAGGRYLPEDYINDEWESFGQFNRTGDTVEWLLRNGVPYAAILRWYIENSNGEGVADTSVEGQVLVISTVADHDNPVSCVVGYVDARANPSANAQAREIADQFAMTFRCGIDQAEFHGIRGPYSGDIVRSFD